MFSALLTLEDVLNSLPFKYIHIYVSMHMYVCFLLTCAYVYIYMHISFKSQPRLRLLPSPAECGRALAELEDGDWGFAG